MSDRTTREVRVDLPEALVREARSRMAIEELTWERLLERLVRAWVDEGRVGR